MSTDEKKILSISKSLKNIVSRQNKTSLSIKGAGIFQNFRNPKVIWLGIKRNKSLQNLQKEIEDAMSELGYKPENREFSPHLTLGRIKWMKDTTILKQLVRKYQDTDFGEFPAHEVILYESTLTPKGSIYKAIENFSSLS